MSDPFIGEIRMVGFNFAPLDWALCNGQTLPIAQYDALFALIGTTYGGDGMQSFGLPDLRGRSPIHVGDWAPSIGEVGGVEQVTLTTSQLPAHPHAFMAMTTSANNRSPQNQALAKLPANQGYRIPQRPVQMVPTTASQGGQAHENVAPYLAINYIIATAGTWPPQT